MKQSYKGAILAIIAFFLIDAIIFHSIIVISYEQPDIMVIEQPTFTEQPENTTTEQPRFIDAREMTFYNQMYPKISISLKIDYWKRKIFPFDEKYLNNNQETLYIEVYVLEVQTKNQTTQDIDTGKIGNIIQVYVPSDRVVEELSKIENTRFYVKTLSPSIGMRIRKEFLWQVAENPLVHCIRIFPASVTFAQ